MKKEVGKIIIHIFVTLTFLLYICSRDDSGEGPDSKCLYNHRIPNGQKKNNERI